MTLVVNAGGGWLIAWINRLPARYGLGIGLILQNRGEFALILATLATAAGLDPRLTPFAGLYVLVMSIVGPVLTVNSERITNLLFRGRREKASSVEAGAATDSAAEEAIALMEGAIGGQESAGGNDAEGEDDEPLLGSETPTAASTDDDDDEDDDLDLDATIQQAMEQSDQQSSRQRDPEY
jgi:CPA2 family monovalent cation:H+ antiporter-2